MMSARHYDMRILVPSCLLAVAFMGQAQSGKVSSSARIERVHEWSPDEQRFFKGEDRKALTTVRSVWAAGNLRYKVRIIAEDLTPDQNDPVTDKSKFLTRLSRCDLWLDLVDANGFRIKRFSIEVEPSVDARRELVALDANDHVPLSPSEYQAFIVGAWAIESACAR